MNLPQLNALPITSKRLLIRFDGDVPVSGGQISDDFRLQAVLPTIQYARQNRASVVLMAHRGRPKGKHDPELSTHILADYFQSRLGEPVAFIDSLLTPEVRQPIGLLENLRFHQGEEQNEPAFARLLARFGDVYCNDAFAVSHRAHASVAAVAELLPHCAGFRFAEEVRQLSPLQHDGEAPYVVILGGAKASDKSPIIADLIDRVDTIVIGGLVAVTYLAAMGQGTGAHEIDENQVKIARECIRRMNEEGVPFLVPVDFVNQDGKVKPITEFGAEDLMLDTGPETTKLFEVAIHKANTIFWNGAMGKFENPAFAAGTIGIARSVASSGAEVRIASGGDTVAAVHANNLSNSFTYISTGGGATLEFIAGKELPGLQALLQASS